MVFYFQHTNILCSYRDFLVLSSAAMKQRKIPNVSHLLKENVAFRRIRISPDLTRLTLVDLLLVPAPGCQQKTKSESLFVVTQKSIVTPLVVLQEDSTGSSPSSLRSWVFQVEQKPKTQHSIYSRYTRRIISGCLLGIALLQQFEGGAFCFFFCHTRKHRLLMLLLFFRTEPEKRRLDKHFFLFLLRLCYSRLRPQRNFSHFESELSSNTKKKSKLNQSPENEQPQRPNCTNQPTTSWTSSGGGSFHCTNQNSPKKKPTHTKSERATKRASATAKSTIHTFPFLKKAIFSRAPLFSAGQANSG